MSSFMIIPLRQLFRQRGNHARTASDGIVLVIHAARQTESYTIDVT